MAVEIHLQAYDYDAAEFKDVAIDPVTKAIKVKDITEAPTDHGELEGLADDDHTQYYNAARHTKEIHDALAIDHGSLFGRGDDDHPQYLNTARHDITTRHPASVLKKSTGSASGSLGSGGNVNIAIHDYAFFPGFGGSYCMHLHCINTTPGYSDVLLHNGCGDTRSYNVKWRYLY